MVMVSQARAPIGTKLPRESVSRFASLQINRGRQYHTPARSRKWNFHILSNFFPHRTLPLNLAELARVEYHRNVNTWEGKLRGVRL
jgi:hypothetical protein